MTIDYAIRSELLSHQASTEVLECEFGQRSIYPECELSASAACYVCYKAQQVNDEMSALFTELMR